MGHPHQAYLVAKFPHRDRQKASKGVKEYLCIAAVYHNMVDGLLPLKSIHRFVTLAKQPDNAEIIREELRLISESHQRPPKKVPSQYLARLLSCAFNFGLEEETPYCRQHLLGEAIEDLPLELWECGNLEGHTIIDITVPENCSYCLLPGPSTFGGGSIHAVIFPEQYARAWFRRLNDDSDSEEEFDETILQLDYRDWYQRTSMYEPFTREEFEQKRQEEVEIRATIDLLEDIPYMDDPYALCEVWPTEFPRGFDFLCPEVPSELSEESLPSTLLPLVDLVLGRAVERVLDTDDADGFESLLRLQPTLARARTILQALRSPRGLSSFTDASINLLAELIQEDWDGITLDLSHLALKKGQVLSLVKHFSNAEVLKMSHNPFVKIDTIHDALEMMPNVRRLVLFNTPISKEEWAALFQDHPHLFYNMDGIVHPCLLNMTTAFYMPTFTFNLFKEGSWNTAIVPFFTNEYLVQTLKRYICTLRTRAIGCADGLLSTQSLKPGMKWSHRSIPFFAQPPAGREVKGTGWTFLHVVSWYGDHYGFVKHTESMVGPTDASTEPNQIPPPEGPSSSPNMTYAVYDIKGFFGELAKEGRPPFSESDVAELTELFEKAPADQHCTLPMRPPPSDNIELISLEEAIKFIAPGEDNSALSRYF